MSNAFISFTQRYSKTIKWVRFFYENKLLDLRSDENNIRFYFDLQKTNQLIRNHEPIEQKTIYNMIKLCQEKLADSIEIYLLGQVLCNGPKIFRPRQFDLEMCEQIDINVAFDEYVQPFPTVVIELPEDYIKNKRVHNPEFNNNTTEKIPKEHEPIFVILHHDPKSGCILSEVAFSSDVSVKSSFVFTTDRTKTIENYFERFNDTEEVLNQKRRILEFEGSLETSMEEWKLIEEVNRACINYCLLLDEIGVKRIGPQNGSEYERLKRYIDVAKKTKDPKRIKKAQDNLQSHGMIYALNQKVKLVRSVNRLEGSEPSGKILSPHHRRGFYRRQHYGLNNNQVKRIRIPPVFVNKHLFVEGMDRTKVIYE